MEMQNVDSCLPDGYNTATLVQVGNQVSSVSTKRLQRRLHPWHSRRVLLPTCNVNKLNATDAQHYSYVDCKHNTMDY